LSKNSEGVKRWRNRTKELIVKAMGNSCQICGYNKCLNGLDLHHIDPSKKEVSFGKIRANPIAIEKIAEELEKCVLLCANCHREIHAGFACIPENYIKFDKSFILKSKVEIIERKIEQNKKISKTLVGYFNKIKITNEDLYTKWIEKYKRNTSAFALELGVSETAIRRRLKRYCEEKNLKYRFIR
jgi:hypothetical protein